MRFKEWLSWLTQSWKLSCQFEQLLRLFAVAVISPRGRGADGQVVEEMPQAGLVARVKARPLTTHQRQHARSNPHSKQVFTGLNATGITGNGSGRISNGELKTCFHGAPK
jgi:hypothetical protein